MGFSRFADDSLILVKSPRAAERVCGTITRFIEKELKLKVNRDKTKIGSPKNLKFLGFKLVRIGKGVGLTPHPKSIQKFKKRIRALTKRNRGVSVERMLNELRLYMKGWIGYYGAMTSDNQIRQLDEWVRRRVRQYILKSWKKRHNKFRKLKALCPVHHRCPDDSVSLDWVKMCWRCDMDDNQWHASNKPAVKLGLSNKVLSEMGMFYPWTIGRRLRKGGPTADCLRRA